MIPKIIHQTWKDTSIPFHIYERQWVDSWKEHHPTWKHYLWTDDDLKAIANQHFPEVTEAMDKGPGVVKADIGRYMVLCLYGGIYADLDYECYKPFDPLLDREILLTYVNYVLVGHLTWITLGHLKAIHECGRRLVSNALIGVMPNHPLMFRAIQECGRRYNENKSIEEKTGPVMLTEIVREMSLIDEVFNANLFSPIDWTQGKGLRAGLSKEDIAQIKKDYPEAYAATYWAHNW
jgi:mannosyltransferase OCH1-like enzyme